jgi:uncharacterized integral membrane protein
MKRICPVTSTAGLHKTVLTILVWGLILEILTLIYYISNNRILTFEFFYLVFIFMITIISIYYLLKREAKLLRCRT